MLADLESSCREILREQVVEARVILLELLAGVDPVVLAVCIWSLGIDIEPVLHALGEILFDVGACISALILALGPCSLEEGCQLVVDLRMYLEDADEMD